MGSLLPGTDGVVAFQALLAVTILSGALLLVRRDRELCLLVIGLMTLTAGFFGLRALH